ncbi:MAG: hypothetical protein JKY37_01605 [Nannocystaceae bacterium]|nr:hypothetical protein [Nannocystaceae bacterium]
MCGNGLVEPGESCDDGEITASCSAECTTCEPVTPSAVTDQELAPCVAASGCEQNWITKAGQSVAQGFQVSQTGTLDTIQLYLRNTASDTSDLTLELVDGGSEPLFPSGLTPTQMDNNVIGSATVNGQEGDPQWEVFDFSNQDIELDPRHHYFIWLRMHPPHPADNGRGLWETLAGVPGLPDPFPGGRQFLCLPEGGPCQVDPLSFDAVFRVRLHPAPPLCGEN